jgi:hypothetical protein
MNKGHTHLPILKALLGEGWIKTAIEFGTGDASTALLSQSCELVVSVEEQDREWMRRAQEIAVDNEAHFVVWHGDNLSAHLDANYDLCFVDGAARHRVRHVEWGFEHARTVVAHDTESAAYGWAAIKVPGGWVEQVERVQGVHTTVWWPAVDPVAARRGKESKAWRQNTSAANAAAR